MISFSDRVIRLAKSIPQGKVTTYGRIARAAGGGGMAAQSITTILAKASGSGIPDIPFHRIVYADGRIWIDSKHRKERLRRYHSEGISITKDNRIKDFRLYLYEFK